MIKFEKIRWKNFLSTGQQFTEVPLSETPSTLIIGLNGAGKSTMLDALCFSLFNKPFRKISRSQLVNSINEKETLVEVEFQVGTINYKVRRGIKPNVFEIYRNNVLVDQDAAQKDTQKFLEQSVLKLNYKSFTQVVILGSSTFVPFMQLGASHRREVIEDILDIQIFSYMNGLLKERIKDIKEEQRQCEYELELAQQKVAMQEKNIENLEKVDQRSMVAVQAKFDENEDRIVEIKELVKTKEKSIDTITPKLLELDRTIDKHEQYKTMRTKMKTRQGSHSHTMEFFKNNNECPTCTQKISDELKVEKITFYETKISGLKTAHQQITDNIKVLDLKVKDLREKAKAVNGFRYEIQALTKEEMKLLKENTKLLSEAGSNTTNLQEEKQELVRFNKKLEKKQEFCAGVNTQHDNLKVVSTLLKDDGIKSKIVSKFIPIINNKINKYLQSMDFYVNFTLDENFCEEILSRHRDSFTYASFSEGEKQKIDLALLFTWREIARMKNSVSTNLLILDEVFDSSLDQGSTDELMKILRGLGDDVNLFVISHKGDILLDKFERLITFDKQSDFSTMQLNDNT